MKMKLLIAVPTTDYVHAEFMKCLVALTMELSGQKIAYDVEIQAGTLVYIARTRLCNKAVNEGYTHILFLDSDMVFKKDLLEDMLFCGKDFVCGAFQGRRPPYSSCIFNSLRPVERVKEYGLQPFPVEGCGMACTLINTEVIKAVQQRYGVTFTPTEEFGEDLAFCWRARSIGQEIWCDPSIRIGHIAHVPIYPGEEPAT